MSAAREALIRGKRVLVTGGAGFIGLHLVERLLGLGAAQVVLLDSLRYSDARFLTPALADPRLSLVRLDIGRDAPERLAEALAGGQLLFHLAAEKHNQSRDSPREVLRVNVQGTHDLFEAAAHAGVEKVVFSSSLYAHGRMHLPALHEADLPEPRTVYGISKLAGELLLAHFAQAHGLRGTSLRLFFVYGPRQYPGTGYKSVLVKNFERMLAGEAPLIVGDGLQALDYVYVDDVVDALIGATAPAADGLTLHVGSGRAASIRELTAVMQRVAGCTLEPVYAPADATAGTHRACAPGLAAERLGFAPTVSLEQGLTRVHDWMRTEAPR